MASKVSAVLLRYKRERELKQIVRNLRQYDFIDEIIIHDNRRINLITYGRYVAAMRAKNKIIYVQDDDCIVNNIRQMYELFDGQRLINAMKRERISFYQGKDSLVGWGCFFDKAWLSVLNKYVDKFGEDFILHREADRIFTSLLETPRYTVCADVTDFPSAMDKSSLSLNSEHETIKRIALERCIEANINCKELANVR